MNRTKIRAQAPPSQSAGQGNKPNTTSTDKASEAQIRAIYATAKKANVTEESIKAKYKVASMSDLTKAQASEIISGMQKGA